MADIQIRLTRQEIDVPSTDPRLVMTAFHVLLARDDGTAVNAAVINPKLVDVAKFTAVPPGTYVVTVQISTPDGTATDPTTAQTVTVTVPPEIVTLKLTIPGPITVEITRA